MAQSAQRATEPLGRFYSEHRARRAVETHLVGSPYHYMDEEQAKLEAELSEVKVEVWDEEDEDMEIEPAESPGPIKRPKPSEPAGPPPKQRRAGPEPSTSSALAETGRGDSTSSQMVAGRGGKAAAATRDLHSAIAK